MKVDIWSDLACPWCWIGKHRFQRGVALLGDAAPPLQLNYHAFQLDPDADEVPVPLRQAYADKFGGLERTEQVLAQTQATARAEGLPFDFDRGQVRVTTLLAHRLLWLATREGDVDAVAEALFHAHFAEGQNLAEAATLIAAGNKGGLSTARVEALLHSDEGLAEVQAQLTQAARLGVTAVPSFIIDGRYLLQGAQTPETFARVLADVAAERGSAAQDDTSAAADVGGTGDGCG